MEIKDLGGLGSYAPIIHELYKDMAQPAARNVGLALGAITSVGLFLHLLTSWGTDRLNICLKNNLEQYADRMKDVALEDVTEAPPEIAVPIIEKLSYVTNEDLKSLYIELLAKASIKDQNHKAHPNFINIINSLSPDEATLLKYINTKKYLCFVDNIFRNKDYSQYFLEELVCIYPEIGLTYDKNLKAYLYNLSANGIINISHQRSVGEDKDYEKYLEYLSNNIDRYKKTFPKIQDEGIDEDPYDIDKGFINLTDYGNLFIEAVI